MMMMLTATMLGIGGVASAATDYSHYSDTQLGGLRVKIQKASNEEQIAYFMEQYNLALVKPFFKSSPKPEGKDGFFAALLERKH